MKIIKPSPILSSTDTWQQTCSYCEAVLEYDITDITDLHYYSDQREGDYYSAKSYVSIVSEEDRSERGSAKGPKTFI